MVIIEATLLCSLSLEDPGVSHSACLVTLPLSLYFQPYDLNKLVPLLGIRYHTSLVMYPFVLKEIEEVSKLPRCGILTTTIEEIPS